MMISLAVIFAASVFVYGLAAYTLEFPDTIERCPAADTECMASLITTLMARSAKGIPELDVPAMDPLYFGSGAVSQQNAGPVSMNITINNGWIHGWSKMIVKKVVGFEKDPKRSQFELHVNVPIDQIIGQYELSGRALLIPVTSTGAINLTLEHLDMVFKFKTVVITRDDGEEYLNLEKINLHTKAKKMYVKFDNLFSNKAISDNANMLMNQYQEMLFLEIQKSYNTGRSLVLEPILRPIFEKYPYRKWFTDSSTPTTNDVSSTTTPPLTPME